MPHCWYYSVDEEMWVCWDCDTYHGSHLSTQPCHSDDGSTPVKEVTL